MLKSCILILLSFLLVSCTYSQVTVFEDGKLKPNDKTTFRTMDGNLNVTYFIERYKQIQVDDEKMLWPSTFPPYQEIWVDETDKEVKATIRIINQNQVPYVLIFNQVTKGDFGKPKYISERVIYNGRLPYQEHIVEIRKVKGKTEVWFEIYRKGKIYCFTRSMKFKY